MKAKLYHLSTCNTCKKIIDQLPAGKLDLQDIKTEKITENQLEEMVSLAGNYESLFSRRAMKFRSRGLHEKSLTETDYKELILEEYTFLKRPVAVVDGQIFIGSAKKNVEALKEILS